MSFEIEFATAAPALPTSGGVSYQTSWSTSRQPSRRPPSPPFVSSSPPRDTPNDSYSREKDISNDENISVLDPRRFTPNLHASLVSEILSLRREIENKNSILGTLEENLHDNKMENDQLKEALKAQSAEVRSVNSHMHSLETGTLRSLDELAKERDGAVENLSDTQKRLEASKSKARRHEEEIERTQGLWDRDRQVWDDEKRNMERKIHVVEGRLRTILTEVAAQSSASQSPPAPTEIDHGMRETWFTKSSDSTSNRSNSVQDPSRFSGFSNNTQDGSDAPNFRFSTSTGLNGFGATKLNGLSLAEELEIDEEGEGNVEEFNTDDDLASPDALPEEAEMRRRRSSASSQGQDHKARKVLGLVAGCAEGLGREEVPTEQRMETIDERSNCIVEEPAFQCKDIGIQTSTPPSPKLQVHDAEAAAEKNIEQSEHTANQRRKRVSVPSTVFDQAHLKPGPSLASPMVSAGCQTLEPLSPLMPMNAAMPSVVAASHLANGFREMKSAMTQTNHEDILMLIAAVTRDEALMTVPTIAIHPPGSRPPSSHNGVVLPPRTKSVGCQVSIAPPISVRSISVQTEEIRSERRPHKIPPRLLSTKVTSKTTSWRHEDVKEPARHHVAPRKSSRRNNQRATGDPLSPHARAPIKECMDSYPGNNDNGPLNQKQTSDLRRPIRKQSLFAGFESPSDGEAPAIPEIGFSDDDFATAPPIRKTLSKVQNSWKLVPHTGELGLLPSDYYEGTINNKEKAPEHVPTRQEPALSKNALPVKAAPIKSSARPPNSFHAAREPNIRRAALMSSGTAAHTTQTRSPSAPSSSNNKESSLIAPPFPVPTRSSSRRIPISASDGARSPTPYSSNFFSASNQEPGRPPSKNTIIRKVRSAAAVPKFGRNYRWQSGSRSPPPSTSSFGPESPRPPRLPLHDISSRRARNEQSLKPLSPMSFLSASSVIEDPTETFNQSTNVVDAIAQTMVGEWMWKYVRRRKSFGISESPQVEFDAGQSNGETGAGSGIRHKRWVWLAPYERAIMWSSKQPTSGPALLGKSGRKLAIQSVLDVKDDTPIPKNSESHLVFNRSILILTPQRALKFTATTSERHHLWLTALSFLSQSSHGMSDLADIPSIPRREHAPPSSRESNGSHRTPIFDSMRMAKSKGRPLFEGHRAYSSPLGICHTQEVSEGRTTYVEDDSAVDAAEAPHVPRVSYHSRKRSSTGPRSGPPSISHTFMNKATLSSSNISLQASLTRDGFSAFPPYGNPGIADYHTGSSRMIRNNFFDAVGTVRMEAFIDEGESKVPSRTKETKVHRGRQGRKKDLSYWGVGGPIGPSLSKMQQGHESRWKGDDPFKGF